MERCVNTLREWTGKSRANVLYDSTVDELTHDGLFNNVKGKPNITLVGFTADGDVFGGFYNVAATEQDRWFNDPTIFAFSFESHGRCDTPQRFLVKEETKICSGVKFYKNPSFGAFVWFYGEHGWFSLGNERSGTHCVNTPQVFDGIEDTTLTGKNNFESISNTRLVAVQRS